MVLKIVGHVCFAIQGVVMNKKEHKLEKGTGFWSLTLLPGILV